MERSSPVMLKTSKKLTAKPKVDPARPFGPAILAQARSVAGKYRMTIWYDEEAGEYYARGVELPLLMGDGETPDECVENTREVFVTALAVLLEQGQKPPAIQDGASEKSRSAGTRPVTLGKK